MILKGESMKAMDIHKLKVAKPCNASWDEMTGDDRSRMCGRCNLRVYNFAAFGEQEILDLMRRHEGRRVCGMLFRRTDGTLMTRDCPVGAARRMRRRVLGLAATAAAFLSGCWTGFGSSNEERALASETASEPSAVQSWGATVSGETASEKAGSPSVDSQEALDAKTLELLQSLGSLGYVE